jgi:hypothetical protein
MNVLIIEVNISSECSNNFSLVDPTEKMNFINAHTPRSQGSDDAFVRETIPSRDQGSPIAPYDYLMTHSSRPIRNKWFVEPPPRSLGSKV